MDYIVMDLEWNQGSHREAEPGTPGFEIIEIGAVKLNERFELTDRYQRLIKPQIYMTMHKVTQELVNLRISDLKREARFPEVAADFLRWCGEDYIFCSWGVQDLTEFQRNMDYYQMDRLSEGPLKYYDIQKLYSLYKGEPHARHALSAAVAEEGLEEKKIPFHRALGDAYYTARLFERIRNEALLQRVSFDTYRIPFDRKHQISWQFDDYSKFISIGYEEKAEILRNKNIACVRCIYCNKALRKKLPWYSNNNGKHYYTVAKCPEHGLMKGKIRIRKSHDDRYYAVKTVKHIGEEEAKQIVEKSRPSEAAARAE